MANPIQAQYAVTDLAFAGNLTGGEVFEVIQGGQSAQASINQVATALGTLLPVPLTQSTLNVNLLNFTAKSVNFNSANTDTTIPIVLPTGITTWRMGGVFIVNPSASLTTATCGLFTAAGGGGFAIVTGGSAITVSTAAANTNNNMQVLNVNNQNTQSFNLTSLFFRVGTAQGSAATADVVVLIGAMP